MRHRIPLAVLAALAFAAPAQARWITYGTLHAREQAALERVAREEQGMTEGCHVYGHHHLEVRCNIDVPIPMQPPLSGYSYQTFSARQIPHYGIFWTAVTPVGVRIFSDNS